MQKQNTNKQTKPSAHSIYSETILITKILSHQYFLMVLYTVNPNSILLNTWGRFFTLTWSIEMWVKLSWPLYIVNWFWLSELLRPYAQATSLSKIISKLKIEAQPNLYTNSSYWSQPTNHQQLHEQKKIGLWPEKIVRSELVIALIL